LWNLQSDEASVQSGVLLGPHQKDHESPGEVEAEGRLIPEKGAYRQRPIAGLICANANWKFFISGKPEG
jgi:hypothetical protein